MVRPCTRTDALGLVGEAIACTETEYNALEAAWYGRADGPRRCVVRFEDFLADLPGVQDRVWRELLDADVPADMPRVHPPRERTRYLLDRDLAQAGIDEAAFRAGQVDYLAWLASLAPRGH